MTDAEQLPYTLAIHAGAGENPHCHLMISERGNDGLARSPAQWFKRYNAAAPEQGGARKSTAYQQRPWLAETRAAWAALTQRLEHQHAPGVWGVSRERWKGLVVTLFVTLGVAMLYHAVGPPAQKLARVEEQNATWQQLWAVTTEAEREQILKRAGEKQQ